MNKTALNVLKKINDNGYKAFLVGGYPRDFYLNKESIDFDICTSATPKQLKDIFGDLILPSENYGSVTLILNNFRFEITTFRRELKYLNNRKPIEIEYITDLLEDLKRRDFTMNTMCIDKNGLLIDLLNGKNDIDNRIIKTVGDAFKKIEEDSLRILRAIRFATVLNFKLTDDLKSAILKNKHLLKSLSYYRKKEELDKIFSHPNASVGIDLIKELKLEEELELSNIDNLVLTTYQIGIWAQLDVTSKYSFNKVEKTTIKQINELRNKNVLDPNNIYKYGLYISTIVGEILKIDIKKINEIYNNLYIHNKSEIKIEASEVCVLLNKKAGKFLNEIYSDLEYKLVNKLISNKKEDLKKYILEKY